MKPTRISSKHAGPIFFFWRTKKKTDRVSPLFKQKFYVPRTFPPFSTERTDAVRMILLGAPSPDLVRLRLVRCHRRFLALHIYTHTRRFYITKRAAAQANTAVCDQQQSDLIPSTVCCGWLWVAAACRSLEKEKKRQRERKREREWFTLASWSANASTGARATLRVY